MHGAGAAAAPFAPTPSSGSSKSWNAQKNNVLRIVGLMLAAINTSANQPSKGLYPDSFNAFTAEQASSEDVYVLFATFVAKEYATGRAGAFTGLQQDVRGVQQEVRAMRIAQEQHAKTMLSVLTQLQSQLYNIGSNTGSPREPTSPAGAPSSSGHSPMRPADRTLHGSAVDVGGNGGLTTSAAAGATLSACGAAAGGGRAAAASSAGGSASSASNDIAAASAVRPIDVARANGGTAPPNTVALLPMSTRTAAAPRAAVVLTSQAHSQPQATSYKGLNRPQPPNLNGPCSVCSILNNDRFRHGTLLGRIGAHRRPSAGVQRCQACRGPRRPPRGSPPGPSARHTLRRTARTSDRGCHIVTSAGIAVQVPQMAQGAQVPECSAAGLAAGPAGRPEARG